MSRRLLIVGFIAALLIGTLIWPQGHRSFLLQLDEVIRGFFEEQKKGDPSGPPF